MARVLLLCSYDSPAPLAWVERDDDDEDDDEEDDVEESAMLSSRSKPCVPLRPVVLERNGRANPEPIVA